MLFIVSFQGGRGTVKAQGSMNMSSMSTLLVNVCPFLEELEENGGHHDGEILQEGAKLKLIGLETYLLSRSDLARTSAFQTFLLLPLASCRQLLASTVVCKKLTGNTARGCKSALSIE